jgi:hypothetical protein
MVSFFLNTLGLSFKLAKILECINDTSAPESTKALNSIFFILITVEFGEPVKLIAYCGNLLLSWALL